MVDGRELFITAYEVNPTTQRDIKQSLRDVLTYYGCQDLMLPIFTCINELLVNAVKANYKNIYFENYCPKNSAFSKLPYSKALELFRLEINTDGAENLTRLARERGMLAVLRVSVRSKVMHIAVTNPSPMTEIESSNVTTRIGAVRRLEQMADYFDENEDSACHEGAGLGIVLIGMMLKSLGLSSDRFEIRTDSKSTTASLDIPLDESTLSAYRIITGR
jgi:hypothetical protein